jgi:hypothetical protein
VATEGAYTYLFGNTFEQNLAREGGFRNGPHSGTEMYLARVPRGQFGSAPEYRAGSEWTTDPGRGAADRPAVLGGEPDAAATSRRSVGRGDQGRRVLG